MRWLRVLRETPKWVIITTVAVFVVLVYLGIVSNYFKLAAVDPFSSSGNQYLTIWDHISTTMPATEQSSVIHAICVITSMFFGFICLLLGIARSMNRLDGRTSYLMAAFLIFFVLAEFSGIDSVAAYFKPEPVYIVKWIFFFIYPFPFFLYIFLNLRPSFYKWVWPLFFLPVAYSVAIWLAYLTTGLQFKTVNSLHTALSVSCFIILLTVSFFGAIQKNSIWYTRIIALTWLVWVGLVVIRTLLKYRFRMHDEVLVNIVISTVVTVCYLVFTGSRELFTYKSNAQMLETRNGLLLENYQNIESYNKQIGLMRHEMRNHLLAIKILVDEEQNERLADYLASIQDAYKSPAQPVFCGHRLIQSVLGHAKQRAEQSGTSISIEVAQLPQMSLADTDAVSLLMNLLNNALESCEKIPSPDKRWITVDIKCRAPYLYISVKNAAYHEILAKNNKLVTTKEDAAFHGYGTAIVQVVAKKYDGFTNYTHGEDSFIAEAALRVIVENV